jgi:hypothetical protein
MEMVNFDFFEDYVHAGALKEIHMNETKDFKATQLYTMADKDSGKDLSSPGARKMRTQRCTIEGCTEVTMKTRTSRNWVCKAHQSKLHKEMLKKRLEERCRTPIVDVSFN